MNTTKRTILLMFSFVLLFSNVVFANDYDKMNLKEKAEWIENNVEPEYYDGIKENSGSRDRRSADSGWIYTKTHDNNIYSIYYAVGAMRTKVKWICDDNEDVVNYDVVTFEAYNYTRDGILYKHQDIARLSDINVRMAFDITVVDPFGTYHLTHVYNLHGDGKYSFRYI